MRALFALVLSGCTLVVGGDPRIDTDAGAFADASSSDDDASSPAIDASPEDVSKADVVKSCDAGACNAAKDACKKTCADNAKKCNDACNADDGKSCHDLCNQQQQSCNGACLVTCLQCVMGCGTCGP